MDSLQREFSPILLEGVEYPAVAPRSVEEVAEVVRWCREHAWRILPAGQGHSFPEQHHVPTGVLTVISLGRRGVSDPNSVNLAVDVEAGVPTATLLKLIRHAGLAIENWPEEYPGTVGGLLCGERGPSLRSLILGMILVDGSGTIVRLGGALRKDVSGFDAAGSVIGSRGTVAWLDKVTIRLIPAGETGIARVSTPPSTTQMPFDGLMRRIAHAYDPDDVFFKPEK